MVTKKDAVRQKRKFCQDSVSKKKEKYKREITVESEHASPFGGRMQVEIKAKVCKMNLRLALFKKKKKHH